MGGRMAENSKIEWTDHTFNPWIGCTKVGPGCDNCYAEAREDKRLHRVQWGPGKPRHRTKTWGDPVKWNAAHESFYAQHGRRQRVFCASLADVFDNDVDPSWRRDLFNLIRATPKLDWLLLTKRIGNAVRMLPWANEGAPGNMVAGGMIWPNIWLGATVVNQEEADRDIPKLLATPAARRFLSMEPLLGPVELADNWLYGAGTDEPRVDWVIVGGESGHGARPMHPDWARGLRDQCEAAGVPFLFKQWGEWCPWGQQPAAYTGPFDHTKASFQDFGEGARMERIGKKAAGRLLDGRTHDGVPA
jgi:protein gp37